MKRNLLGIGLLLILVMIFTSLAFAEVKNPDTIINVTIGAITTLDPHWANDSGSQAVIYQIYDNLIKYKGESVTEFVPMLATEVPSVENGLIKDNGLTWIFPIRKDVKFHNGDILTPEDVVYSFKRALIFDPSGGPTWMLCVPLLGAYGIEDVVVETLGLEKYSDLFVDGDPRRGELKSEYKEAMIKIITNKIDKTVEVDGDKVVFHLAQAYAPFMYILAHSATWSSIIDKNWAIAQGAWDGQADNWWKYHDPENEKDPLYAIENGTGPFVLKKWVPEEIVSLGRFDDYWRGPAKIKNVYIKYISEYTTRKLMLQTGDADIVNIPAQYLSEVENIEGVSVTKNLPSLSNLVSMFTWTISAEGNPYIGSGKLDGEGIPPDFFSDIHVRKGFSYLFPYDIFIEKVAKGMAIRNPGPIFKGMLGYTDDPALFCEFSLEKAAEEFKLAWGGQLWEKGCKFTIFYYEGSDGGKAACDMLSTYAKMLNPKFNLEILGLQWSAFLKAYLTEILPIFTSRYSSGYPDPDELVSAYMGSKGDYSAYFGEAYSEFARENVDPLIEQGLKETDPVKRVEIYKELTQIAHNQAISIYIYQPEGHYVQRDWIKGWYWSPIAPGVDFYSLSKGE